jgi:hypothetical protein
MQLDRRRVYQRDGISILEAVRRVPFTVLVPQRPPATADEVEKVEVYYLTPLVKGYFARLDIIYWLKVKGPLMLVSQSDTSPRIDPTVGCDFSDSDQIEVGGRILSLISPKGEHGGCYATFQYLGTHVVIYAPSLGRDRVTEFAASFESAKRKA